MDYSKNLEKLKKYLNFKKSKKSMKHMINNAFIILPFPTREPERARFENGFSGVIGEFTRIVSDEKIVDSIDINYNINKIINNVQVNDEDKIYLEKLIKQYLINSNNAIIVFHTSIFKYFSLNEGEESKGEVKIAHFLRDILCENNSIKYMFEKNNIDNVISKLILDNFNNLENNRIQIVYQNQLYFISELFIEDVTYLFQYKEYFKNNFELLVAYYYFFYITQISLKLNQIEKADYNKVSPVYYMLDWEKASKTRACYKKGYSLIENSTKKLLIHVNTLEHLNQLFGTKGKNYTDLLKFFDLLKENEKYDFIKTLKIWINEYRENRDLEKIELEDKQYLELANILNGSLCEKLKKEGTSSRYSRSVKEISSKFFLKNRKSLGLLLNIKQDFLILLTAICIKNKRKSLKELFREYEKRGIFLDRYSRELIVEMFDKLNIIEKISDSGDAQYVKPIL